MPTPHKGPRMGGSPATSATCWPTWPARCSSTAASPRPRPRPSACGPYAEHLITFGKRGDLHARRQVLKRPERQERRPHAVRRDRPALREPPGWLHRILKVGARKGDNAQMAIIELVEESTIAQQAVGEAERARGTRVARPRPRPAPPASRPRPWPRSRRPPPRSRPHRPTRAARPPPSPSRSRTPPATSRRTSPVARSARRRPLRPSRRTSRRPSSPSPTRRPSPSCRRPRLT
jgi:hypothetical protein